MWHLATSLQLDAHEAELFVCQSGCVITHNCGLNTKCAARVAAVQLSTKFWCVCVCVCVGGGGEGGW